MGRRNFTESNFLMSSVETLPAPQVTLNSDGTKVIVSYRINEAGNKVKITKKVKEGLIPVQQPSEVANRRQWTRYGLEKDNKQKEFKPDYAEEVFLKLQSKNPKIGAKEDQQEQQPKKQSVMTNIICRLCQGNHFSRECPFQGKFGGLSSVAPDIVGEQDGPSGPGGPGPVGHNGGTLGGPGKYVAPGLRGGPGMPGLNGMGPRMGMSEDRDDSFTLRVSNIPENVQDQALREYFSRAGRVMRCHVARDRETGQGRGFAFISFDNERDAENALQMFDGQPVGHLIIHVEYAKKSGAPPRRF